MASDADIQKKRQRQVRKASKILRSQKKLSIRKSYRTRKSSTRKKSSCTKKQLQNDSHSNVRRYNNYNRTMWEPSFGASNKQPRNAPVTRSETKRARRTQSVVHNDNGLLGMRDVFELIAPRSNNILGQHICKEMNDVSKTLIQDYVMTVNNLLKRCPQITLPNPSYPAPAPNPNPNNNPNPNPPPNNPSANVYLCSISDAEIAEKLFYLYSCDNCTTLLRVIPTLPKLIYSPNMDPQTYFPPISYIHYSPPATFLGLPNWPMENSFQSEYFQTNTNLSEMEQTLVRLEHNFKVYALKLYMNVYEQRYTNFIISMALFYRSNNVWLNAAQLQNTNTNLSTFVHSSPPKIPETNRFLGIATILENIIHYFQCIHITFHITLLDRHDLVHFELTPLQKKMITLAHSEKYAPPSSPDDDAINKYGHTMRYSFIIVILRIGRVNMNDLKQNIYDQMKSKIHEHCIFRGERTNDYVRATQLQQLYDHMNNTVNTMQVYKFSNVNYDF